MTMNNKSKSNFYFFLLFMLHYIPHSFVSHVSLVQCIVTYFHPMTILIHDIHMIFWQLKYNKTSKAWRCWVLFLFLIAIRTKNEAMTQRTFYLFYGSCPFFIWSKTLLTSRLRNQVALGCKASCAKSKPSLLINLKNTIPTVLAGPTGPIHVFPIFKFLQTK